MTGSARVSTDGAAAGALTALSGRWRVLASDPASGATNMATDAALLAHARRTGEATFRTYTWERPTLSFGRHERTHGLYDHARLAARGVDTVRRHTGGRALLHHRELTYSVTAPTGDQTLAESYAAINALLRHALAALGVAVSEAERAERPRRPDGSACFAAPAPGELSWRGRKLVGSAQLREGDAFLQHGSILLADDQPLIAQLRSTPAPTPTRPAATLSEALGRDVRPDEVRDALEEALAEYVGAEQLLPPPAAASLRDDLARLEDAFRSPAWTWRR